MTSAKPSLKPKRPVQDEWGLFDPEQAGMPATIRAVSEGAKMSTNTLQVAPLGSETSPVLHCRFCAEALPAGAHLCPRCSNEIASVGTQLHELPLAPPMPAKSQVGAAYALECPIRCPHCARLIRTLRVFRAQRTQVSFTSTLPRKGYVIACPECERLLSAELSGMI